MTQEKAEALRAENATDALNRWADLIQAQGPQAIVNELLAQKSIIDSLTRDLSTLREESNGRCKALAEVDQTLGKVLGYPWYKDDQKNFPEATEADGVCTGEHVAESIASEAANMISTLREERDAERAALKGEKGMGEHKLMYEPRGGEQLVWLVWELKNDRPVLAVICTNDDILSRYVTPDRKFFLGRPVPVYCEKVMADHLYGAKDMMIAARLLRLQGNSP